MFRTEFDKGCSESDESLSSSEESLSKSEEGDYSVSSATSYSSSSSFYSSSCESSDGADSTSSSVGSESDQSSMGFFSLPGDVETLEDELQRFLERRPAARPPLLSNEHISPHEVDGSSVSNSAATEAPIEISDVESLTRLKSDLLNLGNIFASSQGQQFRERAKTLTSISYLAANVPSSVLDHLGREVRHFEMKSRFEDSMTSFHFPENAPSASEGQCKRKSKRSSFYSFDSPNDTISSLPYVAPFDAAVIFGMSHIDTITSLSAHHVFFCIS